MDIMTGLSTIGQAIKTVKDLREIEQGLDSANYKAKMAELYGTLADVKMALADAKELLHSKELRIKELESEIKKLHSGENCPICGVGSMKIVASIPHPNFAFAGIQERTLKCQNSSCGHSEKRLFDPDDRTGTNKRSK